MLSPNTRKPNIFKHLELFMQNVFTNMAKVLENTIPTNMLMIELPKSDAIRLTLI